MVQSANAEPVGLDADSVFTEKKSMCKWTCVQTRIIQGSAIVQSSVLRAVMSISRGCGTGARRKEPIYAWCEQVMRKMKRDQLVENGAGAAQGSGKGVSRHHLHAGARTERKGDHAAGLGAFNV